MEGTVSLTYYQLWFHTKKFYHWRILGNFHFNSYNREFFWNQHFRLTNIWFKQRQKIDGQDRKDFQFKLATTIDKPGQDWKELDRTAKYWTRLKSPGQDWYFSLLAHTKQLLLVTFCDTTAGIWVIFRTDGRTHARTDGRKDRQTWKLK